MAKKKDKPLSIITDNLAGVIADGIKTDEMKEKIREYIEACKLKKKIAKEIYILTKAESESGKYLEGLQDEIKEMEKTLEESDTFAKEFHKDVE